MLISLRLEKKLFLREGDGDAKMKCYACEKVLKSNHLIVLEVLPEISGISYRRKIVAHCCNWKCLAAYILKKYDIVE